MVIIGAGIAGTTAAYGFQQRGVPVLLLEQSEHMGGRMCSENRFHSVFESGQQFYYSSYREVNRLLKAMEMKHEVIQAPIRRQLTTEQHFIKNKIAV